MKEKRPSPVKRLLQWAGPERKWLILSVLCAFGSGILVITSYIGIYRLMDAVLSGACTKAVIADCALLVTAGTVGRLVLLGTSGVLSHKGSLWGAVSSAVHGNGASCQSVSWSLGRAEHRRGQDRSQ